MTKTCTLCNEAKTLDHYYFDRTKNKHISRCKVCWKQFMKSRSKKHYENNKQYYTKRNKVRKKNLIKIIHEYKLKNPTCMDCRLTHPPHRLDFDHLPGSGKRNIVSRAPQNGWSIQSLQEEINKCELVCANCHRDRTFMRARR